MPRGTSRYDEARLQGRLLTPRQLATRLAQKLSFWYSADFVTVDASGLVSNAEDLTGLGRNANTATPSLRLNYFASDVRFGGRPTYGSTSSGGGRYLITPSVAVADVIISTYYGTSTTTPSTFSTFHHMFAPSSGAASATHILTNSGTATMFSGSGFDLDASPSTNGRPESSTVLPLPPSVMVFTRASISGSEVRWIGGDTIFAGRQWVGAYRHVVCSSSFLTRSEIALIEGVIAWDDGFQNSLAASHPFVNRPPLIGD